MRESRYRTSTHRVDITKSVRGGDLTECVGIVHHRSEEIHGLDQGGVSADLIDAGVVSMVETNQNIWVGLLRQFRKYAIQHRGTQFGRASASFDGFC